MRIGFITSCLPELKLELVASCAAGIGYQALEVAAWPRAGDRPFAVTHLDVDETLATGGDHAASVLRSHGLEICSVAYYDNNLDPDPAARRAVNAHVAKCIDAAALIGAPTVGTFIGRDWTRTVAANLREAEEIFKPLVDRAGQRGVKIVIENCVMQTWHPDGYPGNLAYSPELWEWMFAQGLYLNFDPSHLLWLGIDPLAVIEPYADRIALAQAKDIELSAERRNRYGWPGKAIGGDGGHEAGWWRYRMPGLGQVDWSALIGKLRQAGYDGVLSVEHEDPEQSGTPEKVRAGLEIAYRTLRPLIAA